MISYATFNDLTVTSQPIINDNNSNDTYLDETGQIAIVTDEKDIIQNAQTNLRLFTGEYEFDVSIGVAWMSIYGEQYSNTLIQFINAQFTQNLLTIPQVDRVLNISYVYNEDERKLPATISIQLVNGVILNANI